MNRRDAGKVIISGAAGIAAYSGALTAAFAEDSAPGPVLAVVSHPVADFAAWRVVYDEARPVREAAGVTGAEIFVDATNPLLVVVIHRFPTLEAAQGFFNNPDLADDMKRGGVTAPPTIILATAG